MPRAAAERRRTRTDPLVALHHHLADAREQGGLDAIVVADASGIVVAGAGSWALCEELAAFAPLLVAEHDPGSLSHRIASLRAEVDVMTVQVGNQPVLLCARGGRTRRETVSRTAEGVSRILGSP